MAHFGRLRLRVQRDGQSVDINARKFDGYLDVKHRKSTWIMKPVLSHTGALRLEDVKGRMLMLQIADKSMLMDTQIGQRVVDNCVHEKQREATPRARPPGDHAPSRSASILPRPRAAPQCRRAASAASAAEATPATLTASRCEGHLRVNLDPAGPRYVESMHTDSRSELGAPTKEPAWKPPSPNAARSRCPRPCVTPWA
jgi:hypothetical protein